jgi:hypothetical protein
MLSLVVVAGVRRIRAMRNRRRADYEWRALADEYARVEDAHTLRSLARSTPNSAAWTVHYLFGIGGDAAPSGCVSVKRARPSDSPVRVFNGHSGAYPRVLESELERYGASSTTTEHSITAPTSVFSSLVVRAVAFMREANLGIADRVVYESLVAKRAHARMNASASADDILDTLAALESEFMAQALRASTIDAYEDPVVTMPLDTAAITAHSVDIEDELPHDGGRSGISSRVPDIENCMPPCMDALHSSLARRALRDENERPAYDAFMLMAGVGIETLTRLHTRNGTRAIPSDVREQIEERSFSTEKSRSTKQLTNDDGSYVFPPQGVWSCANMSACGLCTVRTQINTEARPASASASASASAAQRAPSSYRKSQQKEFNADAMLTRRVTARCADACGGFSRGVGYPLMIARVKHVRMQQYRMIMIEKGVATPWLDAPV